jgi:methanogenic corrinoid protein MtbC1
VGSAHSEVQEVGALLLTIYLRRSGYHVHYLGENLPVEEEAVKDLIHEARRHQPTMILFSASTPHAAEKLGQLSSRLTQSSHLPAIVGYSGSIYNHHPELRAATAGVYIGAYAKEVVQNLNELLAERDRATQKRATKKDDKKKRLDRNAVQNFRR